MNIRHFFLLITLSILMVSTKAKSGCVEGDNYLLPAGHSYTLYSDMYQAYNDELTVCVSHNYGAPVRVEDGDGQELFTLETDSGCAQYQDVDTVQAVCEGVGSDDCNISWNICGETPEFTISEPPTTRPTTIDDYVAGEEDNEEHVVILKYVFSQGATAESSSEEGSSRPTKFSANPCPEGMMLTSFEMPILHPVTGLVIDFQTVWYCIPEDTPIPQ